MILQAESSTVRPRVLEMNVFCSMNRKNDYVAPEVYKMTFKRNTAGWIPAVLET